MDKIRLRKFTVRAAREIILNGGGSIECCCIVYSGDDPKVLRACQYLIERWDYDFRVDYTQRPLLTKLMSYSWQEMAFGSLLLICLCLIYLYLWLKG